MAATIEAIYENGVFKPQGPVSLAEGQVVRLTVDTEPSASGEKPTAREVLEKAGMVRELSPYLKSLIIPGVTLEEVRESLGKAGGKPLSEIIIEQRGAKP